VDAVLSLREAAEITDASVGRLRRLIRAGRLPATKEGRRLVVRLSGLLPALGLDGDRLTLVQAARELGVTEQRARVLVAGDQARKLPPQLPAARVPRLRIDAPLMVRRVDLDAWRQQPRKAGRPRKDAAR
jgi:excisionase family DNA binding protein